MADSIDELVRGAGELVERARANAAPVAPETLWPEAVSLDAEHGAAAPYPVNKLAEPIRAAVVPLGLALFIKDASQEKLAEDLANSWPSSSLWSDEAGLVVGSHGMAEERAMRFVALLNRLWDGGSFDQRRIQRGHVRIEGRRF